MAFIWQVYQNKNRSANNAITNEINRIINEKKSLDSMRIEWEEKVEEKLIQPTFICDFPIDTSPLAKKCEDNPLFVQRFEHYVAGMECSNNYSEIK